MPIDLREKIRRYLFAYNVSIADADKIAGVPHGRLANFLYERSSDLSIDYLAALAQHAKIEASWFLDGNDDLPTNPIARSLVPIRVEFPGHDPLQKLFDSIEDDFAKGQGERSFGIFVEDRLPYFRRGDAAMFLEGQPVRAGVLVPALIVETWDVYELIRKQGQLTTRAISESQIEGAPFDGEFRFMIKLIRSYGDGRSAIIEAKDGITLELLNTLSLP